MTAKNKDQHFIPAFYLYNFTNAEQKSLSANKQRRDTNIYHYDFQKKTVAERPIRKLATSSYLLSYQKDDGSYDHSLDLEVQEIESRASKVIDNLANQYHDALKSKSKYIEIQKNYITDLLELIAWQIKRHPEMVQDVQKCWEQHLLEHNKPMDHSKEMALTIIKEFGASQELNIVDELQKKNKIIVCTSREDAHFITTDKPFVRYNKTKPNGIAVQDTEIYFPITSTMLLLMCNNGNKREFRMENYRSILRQLNHYLGKHASNYLFGPNKTYLARIAQTVDNHIRA